MSRFIIYPPPSCIFLQWTFCSVVNKRKREIEWFANSLLKTHSFLMLWFHSTWFLQTNWNSRIFEKVQKLTLLRADFWHWVLDGCWNRNASLRNFKFFININDGNIDAKSAMQYFINYWDTENITRWNNFSTILFCTFLWHLNSKNNREMKKTHIQNSTCLSFYPDEEAHWTK